MEVRDYQKKKSNDYFGKGIVVLVLFLIIIQFIMFIVRLSIPVPQEVVVVRDTIYIEVAKPQYDASHKTADKIVIKPMVTNRSVKNPPVNQIVSKNNFSNEGYSKWQKQEVIDINVADSVTLLRLPGIGPYYAGEIIKYRKKLGSYAAKEQLLELWGMDSTKFSKIESRISVDNVGIKPIDLYTMPLDSMRYHPYIGYYAAEGVVRYRSMVKREEFTIQSLVDNNIISSSTAWKLELYE